MAVGCTMLSALAWQFGGQSGQAGPEPVGAQEGPKLGWGVTSGSVREPRAEAILDLLGSAGMGLFASAGPTLLWANYLWNAFLILKEIT